MILETIGHRAGVRARVDLEAVRDSVFIKNVMQLGRIGAQAVLIAHVDRDSAILAQISNVLVDEGQWSVRRPLRHHIRLQHSVLHRQIKIKRRILGVGRPGRRAGKLGAREKGKLRRILGSLHRFEALFHLRIGGAESARARGSKGS